MNGTFSFKVNKVTAENKFSKYFWAIIGQFFKKIKKHIDCFFGQIVRNRVSRKGKIDPKKVFFQTFQGDYTCNPKYITEEMLKQGVDANIVWAGRKRSICTPGAFPYGVKTVDIYSYEMMQEISTAKIIITNSVEYHKRKLPIKKGQVVFQTWHGSLGIKRFDKGHNNGKAWVKAAEYNGKVADYCISNSTFENDVYRESFWDKSEILEYGHPRNDILVRPMDDALKARIKEIREGLEIPEGAKIVLYGPTFRDAHNFDCYNIKPDILFLALKARFGGEWVLLTRYHPTVRKLGTRFGGGKNIINVSRYPDIQELMLIADIAITDYSSWIYDFMLTRKPGFIFATDIEKYDNERGFYFSLYSTPFPVATSPGELALNVLDFDDKKYADDLEAFLVDKGCFEDGHAAERTVEKIKEILAQAEVEAQNDNGSVYQVNTDADEKNENECCDEMTDLEAEEAIEEELRNRLGLYHLFDEDDEGSEEYNDVIDNA